MKPKEINDLYNSLNYGEKIWIVDKLVEDKARDELEYFLEFWSFNIPKEERDRELENALNRFIARFILDDIIYKICFEEFNNIQERYCDK